MRRITSMVGSGLLLALILVSTAVVAILGTPERGQPTTLTTSASSVLPVTNSTTLTVRLSYPNGTQLTSGQMFAGSIGSENIGGLYNFRGIDPGTYALNLTGIRGVLFPSVSLKVLRGTNAANMTVYRLQVFEVVETPSLSLNGTRPGPSIAVRNGTAVTFMIRNNTTLIHNIAVVNTLYNTNASSILFDSLSDTVAAGGAVNDTFIVSRVGSFYYECLIGSHSTEGEWGSFVVVNLP